MSRKPSKPPLTPDCWSAELPAVLHLFGTDVHGLTDTEASKRLTKVGPNEVHEDARTAKLVIFAEQFRSPLIYILLVAGFLTVAMNELVDAAVILIAILTNAILGFWQENKAADVLENLKAYVRLQTRVTRQGKIKEIDAAALVPGDIIHLAQGDRVPADCRLISAHGLEVDESVLTGESLPVTKDSQPVLATAPLAERTCMLHTGTLVVQGSASALVVATGSNTEFGRIAQAASQVRHEPTPLQRAVSSLSASASLILGFLTLLLFVWGVMSGKDAFDMLLVAVAVGVSAVPEGLPIALTVILAIGVERLAKQNGVVKKLLAAETLGSTSLILTDKTGTLTQAAMCISSVTPFGHAGEEAAQKLLELALANTEALIQNPDDPPEDWRLLGRPMECALVRDAAIRYGVRRAELKAATETLDRLPFNSTNKYSAVLWRRDHTFRLAVLGAPEILLKLCDLPSDSARVVESSIQTHAASGERVLGVAYADYAEAPRLRTGLPGNLRFAGLIALRDPLRPGVKDEIARIAQSGVRTVIVTGDHMGTAEAVARELGLLDGDSLVMTGQELAALGTDELRRLADRIKVFARVTPEQKLQLAEFYRSNEEIVAMTGDGVNDAPALQAADIGIAVGSGTEAAKSAADLVLLNDDFGTIITAIEQGRRILGNIRKVIVYLLSDALDELILIGGSLVLGLPLPISALQILFINLFSDSFPAVAFAFEHLGSGRRRPKSGPGTVFDRDMRVLILVVGTLNSFLLFVLYAVLLKLGYDQNLIRTLIFSTFGTYTLFAAFSLRSFRIPIWRYNPLDNPLLTAGVAIGLVLTLIAVYFPPLAKILHVVPLPPVWLLGVFLVGLGGMAVIEAGKAYLRATAHKAH